MGLAWLAAAALAFWAIATVPYFNGFFRAKLPSPTYGTGGILWSALTLALLTLPVVIVATEEAIAAVPRSVREGSYGCGASKWQTIKRIVLPQALPGIMTGGILAMARGAGEVAPLMLLGAMKIAPELPIDHHFPFIHPERSYMHLGFHIYDLGFQSPNSEAARPLAWTTTLLLVVIVLVLNLSAVIARARLRARVVSSSV
jgi:phosphate transport system permease protein